MAPNDNTSAGGGAAKMAPKDDNGSGGGGGAPPPPPAPTFASIAESFCGFDINRDGTIEINSLDPLFAGQEPYTSAPDGVIFVFVDPRLVTNDAAIGVSRAEMMLWLAQLRQDLFNEGYFPYFVSADVYAGSRHQDGRTLLAMRRVLQRIRQHYPLSATLLVGSFPDAAIVRTVLVKGRATEDSPRDFASGATPLNGFIGDFLKLGSDLITERGEIVLGDLDGRWEDIYQESVSVPQYFVAPSLPTDAFPVKNQVFDTDVYGRTPMTYQDVFHIKDHKVIVDEGDRRLVMKLGSLEEPNPEVSDADRQQKNILARPEIVVGRINSRSVAVTPRAGAADLDGRSALDAEGRPQTLRFQSSTLIRWWRDPTLERRLIAEYLARAHALRLEHGDSAGRVSAIRGPDSGLKSPASFNTLLRDALPGAASTATDNANPIDFLTWLQEPAILRGIAAHCGPTQCQFSDAPSARALEVAAGAWGAGKSVWRWRGEMKGNDYWLTPSFEGFAERADFHFYRTLYENKLLRNAGPMFIIHDGCEVTRPDPISTPLPYSGSYYGQADNQGTPNNGESLLFYANGLGLMARSKVFNDTPQGFGAGVRASGGRFGYGWKQYFYADGADGSLNENGVSSTSLERRTRTYQRKRSYYWNLIGDPTLKLAY